MHLYPMPIMSSLTLMAFYATGDKISITAYKLHAAQRRDNAIKNGIKK